MIPYKKRFFILCCFLVFPFIGDTASKDIGDTEGLHINLLFRRSLLNHCVIDPQTHLPYISNGEQFYLKDYKQPENLILSRTKGSVIFKPRRTNASSASCFSKSSSLNTPERGFSPIKENPQSSKKGFLGVLRRNQGRPKSSSLGHVATGLRQEQYTPEIPPSLSTKLLDLDQNPINSAKISKTEQSYEASMGEVFVRGRSSASLPTVKLISQTLEIEAITASQPPSATALTEARVEPISPNLLTDRLNETSLELPLSEEDLTVKSTRSLLSLDSIGKSTKSFGSLSEQSYFIGNLGEKVTTPHEGFWTAISYLKLILDDVDGVPVRTYVGTACVIDANKLMGTTDIKNSYLMTAAHNTFLRAYDTGISRIDIYPGSSALGSLAELTADLYIVHPEYVETQDDSYKNFDIALIKVAGLIDSRIQRASVEAIDPQLLANQEIYIPGFPAMIHEREEGSPDLQFKSSSGIMYNMKGRVLHVGEHQISYDATTYPGLSGAPVVKGTVAFGVHTYGGSVAEGNVGTRISEPLKDLLRSWIADLERESPDDTAHA